MVKLRIKWIERRHSVLDHRSFLVVTVAIVVSLFAGIMLQPITQNNYQLTSSSFVGGGSTPAVPRTLNFADGNVDYQLTIISSNAYIEKIDSSGLHEAMRILSTGPGSLLYSVNNSKWHEMNISAVLRTNGLITNARSSTANQSADFIPDSTPTNTFWWDHVYFGSGYPYTYPHPYNDWYSIYPQYNWQKVQDWIWRGNGVWHYQIGSDYAGPVAYGGDAALGGIIGGIIGALIGGAVGAAIGVIVGGLIVGILSVYENVHFFDESNAIWFWTDESYYNATQHIPWYVWLGGEAGVASWLMSNLHYFRVGDTTFMNHWSWNDP